LPGRDTAFVVHLVTGPAAPAGRAEGRVEHVATGRTARFESAEELLRFMQETLVAISAAGL